MDNILDAVADMPDRAPKLIELERIFGGIRGISGRTAAEDRLDSAFGATRDVLGGEAADAGLDRVMAHPTFAPPDRSN